MKFVIEKSTEPFKYKETWNYTVEYDEKLDKYGLLLDGYFFTFLNTDQANLLKLTMQNPKFEEFFNSVGIGDENLNMQPKAACDLDYLRPTGEIGF